MKTLKFKRMIDDIEQIKNEITLTLYSVGLIVVLGIGIYIGGVL